MAQKEKSGHKKRKTPYKTTVKRARIAGILCLVVVASLLLLMSPLFKIKTINVEGNIKIQAEEIISRSGIKVGNNIFAINDEKAQKNIKKLSKIESVKFVRDLPSTVTIKVDEEIECAYIKEKGTYTAINEEGKAIVTASPLNSDAPVIEGVRIFESELGQYIEIDSDNAKELSSLITRMLKEFKAGSMLDDIKIIDISDLKNIRLTLTNNTLVNMGIDGEEDGNNIEYKIAYLKAIIPELPENQNGGVIELADTKNVTSRMS